MLFLLGDSPASELYVPTFHNTVSVLKHRRTKFRCRGIIQMKKQHLEYGQSLKSRIKMACPWRMLVQFLWYWMAMWMTGGSVLFPYTVKPLCYECERNEQLQCIYSVWCLQNTTWSHFDLTVFYNIIDRYCFPWMSLYAGFTLFSSAYSIVIVFQLQEEELIAYALVL